MMGQNDLKIDFIGIGAPKAGTSWISQCLREHPDICMPYVEMYDNYKKDYNYNKGYKETHFFSLQYEKGLSYYKNLFENCRCGQKIGEFTPDYLNSQKAAKRIKYHFPDVKLIACLRNPIHRALSHYNYIIHKYPSLKNDKMSNVVQKERRFIDEGLYFNNLKKYFEVFNAEQIKILIFEEVINDPQKYIKELYEFLGVDKEFVPPSLNKKVNKTVVYNLKYPVIRKLLKSIKNTVLSVPYGEKINKRIKKSKLDNKIMSKMLDKQEITAFRQNITPEERKYLTSLFQDDIVRLEGLLGRDLSIWKNTD